MIQQIFSVSLVFILFSPGAFAGLKEPLSYLSDYLFTQGYDNFVINKAGAHPDIDDGYQFQKIECRFEIHRCRVVVEHPSAEGHVKTQSLWYIISSQQLGWEAKRNIRQGEAISDDDFIWRMTDAFSCKNQLAKTDDMTRKPVAVRKIKSGQALCEYDLEKGMDVQKGDFITLVSRSDSFEITLKVKALSKGNRGETVKVRIPGSGTMLDAAVVSSGKVELVR
ncbi:flagellar basal body P-ring formation chaperone FlgA [Photobacterium sp. CCB-ST2H9]|uniref:flagellar basal body P-ring formation chaperone FlgA n=1 Tax=Photobacterium sp. CCB-ST2H9 TaxID=2912855 RepID=UPI002005E84B|nr:flagellar basal body P-ring formation chaperone FlgA [Photobacterium sp. CCB-ST2H9]UTM58465.1 flagellar basal body P-ring formation chaperone FlgA [Photobacterium sp. CCB-ST2H9]